MFPDYNLKQLYSVTVSEREVGWLMLIDQWCCLMLFRGLHFLPILPWCWWGTPHR